MRGETVQAREAGKRRELATLGGGCFWCLEPVFEALRGVEEVTAGYSGGHVPDPTYAEVCSGETGHAEVVQVSFDPAEISYRQILEVFFSVHDPTTPGRQGADVGPQYRSVILFHDEEQRAVAAALIREIEAAGVWGAPVVTEVVPFQVFYPAEGYHQGYYRKNPHQGYCRVVIDPKVAKFRERFRHKLKPTGVSRG